MTTSAPRKSKKEFDPKIIKECKDELTVKPFTTNDFGNKNETKF